MITVALYHGPPAKFWLRVAHRIICAVTGSKYSHCEMIDAEGYGWTASYVDGGVRRKQIDFDSSHWDLIELSGDLATAAEWFEAHKGEGYDVFGLLGFVLPWRVSDRTRWFCSEAIAEALGWPQSWRVGPQDLADMAEGDHA
jgi:hypothetical protein